MSHFAILVCSDEKPTEAVLEKILTPFIPEKFNWWTLGGRYSGNLIPHSIDDTITGGDEVPNMELLMAKLIDEASGAVMQRPGCRGSGVDAVHGDNLKKCTLTNLRATVAGGQFYDGLPECDVPDDTWFAIVDCHE